MTRLARHGTALAAVTFLLSSCATGGASTSVPTRFPTRVGANVQVIVTRRDYPVSGLTLRSLAESIRGSGVRDAGGVPRAALYGWQFRYTWTTRRSAASCAVASATVAVDATVTLPRRTEDAAVIAADTAWTRCADALEMHEAGHHALALRDAAALQQALRDISALSCADVATAARRIGDAAIRRAQARSEAYDVETRHGATQGVVWGGPVR